MGLRSAFNRKASDQSSFRLADLENDLEDDPLLLQPDHNGEASTNQIRGAAGPASRRRSIALQCFFMLMILEMSGGLSSIPLIQIQEAIICRSHYDDVVESSQDPRCKNENVQAELSALRGWELTFSMIPGILSAIPYGMVADKRGRKVILCWSVVGILLSQGLDAIICRRPDIFSVRMIWLAPFLNLIGGGPGVFSSTIFTVANDLFTGNARTTFFFWLTATAMGGDLLSRPLNYAAMTAVGPWPTVFIGIACLFIVLFLALALPETRDMGVPENYDALDEARPHNSDNATSSGLTAWLCSILEQASALFLSLFRSNKHLMLLLITLVFASVGSYSRVMLMQYAAKRFGYAWSEAALLSSVAGLVNLALVLAILPSLSRLLLLKLRLSSFAKDLWLVRGGIIFLTLGTFGIGLASNKAMLVASLVVFALGSGSGPSMRSLLTSMAGNRHTGVLFAVISVFENAGLLIAGPTMAMIFKIGLRWGQQWTGLPFLSVGLLLACAATLVNSARLNDPKQIKPDGELDNGD